MQPSAEHQVPIPALYKPSCTLRRGHRHEPKAAGIHPVGFSSSIDSHRHCIVEPQSQNVSPNLRLRYGEGQVLNKNTVLPDGHGLHTKCECVCLGLCTCMWMYVYVHVHVHVFVYVYVHE